MNANDLVLVQGMDDTKRALRRWNANPLEVLLPWLLLSLAIALGLLLAVYVLATATMFLPLAAWIVASRNDDWEDLLAATVVTVALAVPVLLASAAVETWLSPELLQAIALGS